MISESAKPFCECFSRRRSPVWTQEGGCKCGEEEDVEWGWEEVGGQAGQGGVVLSEAGRGVVFHPVYSSGTALVRAEMPLLPAHHYYWEVKMLSEVYGTDIMVGVGSGLVRGEESARKFTSLLGEDEESYGLSYTGRVLHAGRVVCRVPGFCRGSLVGVAVDTWRGTLRFYLNRKPIGIEFSRLRRHGTLYPMLSSTAAQSRLRLASAARRPATLQAAAAPRVPRPAPSLPPGLRQLLRAARWRPFPMERCITEHQQKEDHDHARTHTSTEADDSAGWRVLDGYCVDSVERQFRLVIRH